MPEMVESANIANFLFIPIIVAKKALSDYCCKKSKKEEVSLRTPPLERIYDLLCKSHKTHSCLFDHDLAAVDDVDTLLGVGHAHALEVVYHVVLVEEFGVDLLDG